MLQKVSPHETFQCTGEYLKICGNVGKKRYIYINASDNQVYPSGSRSKKARIGFIPIRNSNGDILTADQLDYKIGMNVADLPPPPPRPGQSAFDLTKGSSFLPTSTGLSSLAMEEEEEVEDIAPTRIGGRPGTGGQFPMFPKVAETSGRPRSTEFNKDDFGKQFTAIG